MDPVSKNAVKPKANVMATSQALNSKTCDFSLQESENGALELIIKNQDPNQRCSQFLNGYSMRALLHHQRIEISARNAALSGDPDQ